jgi:hypothetical protein
MSGSYINHLDASKYECEAAKRGCKCEDCKDCQCNAKAERITLSMSDTSGWDPEPY